MEPIPKEVGNLVVMVNTAVIGSPLVAVGAWIAHGKLSATTPSRRQHAGEAALSFFVGKAESMAPGEGEKRERVIRIVVPFLAAFFMFIIASNMVVVFPVPVINRPPTSHFSTTLTLALLSVGGTLSSRRKCGESARRSSTSSGRTRCSGSLRSPTCFRCPCDSSAISQAST